MIFVPFLRTYFVAHLRAAASGNLLLKTKELDQDTTKMFISEFEKEKHEIWCSEVIKTVMLKIRDATSGGIGEVSPGHFWKLKICFLIWEKKCSDCVNLQVISLIYNAVSRLSKTKLLWMKFLSKCPYSKKTYIEETFPALKNFWLGPWKCGFQKPVWVVWNEW